MINVPDSAEVVKQTILTYNNEVIYEETLYSGKMKKYLKYRINKDVDSGLLGDIEIVSGSINNKLYKGFFRKILNDDNFAPDIQRQNCKNYLKEIVSNVLNIDINLVNVYNLHTGVK